MRTTQQMNMVFIRTYGFHFNGISLLDALRRFFDYLRDFIVQKRFTIFHWKNNVVMDLPRTVITFFNSVCRFFVRHFIRLSQRPVPVASYGELLVKF